MTKNLAIIPLRSGSKRIKDKNIKSLNQKPLFYYSIQAALTSKLFDKIIVSSDSQKYLKQVGQQFKNSKKMELSIRPKSISNSKSTTELTLNYILKRNNDFDNIFLIQATSPLLHYKDLIKGYKSFIYNKLDSLFSGYISESFIWSYKKNNVLFSENYDFKKRPMSQDFRNKKIIENGAFYIFKCKKYLKFRNRLFGKIGFYKMSNYLSVDIDNLRDFKLAEFIQINKKFFS